MIKNVFIIICFLIFFHGVAEARGKIVAIQSIRVAPYEKVIQGVKGVCNSKINRLVVSELEGADVVEKITKIKPDMILAIGMNALSMVKEINNIPGLLDTSCMTVTGKTLGENIADAEIKNEEVIHTLDNAYSKTGGLSILTGNLAPNGSVVVEFDFDYG